MINLCEKSRTEDEIVAMVKNGLHVKVALKNDIPKRQKVSISETSKDNKQWDVDELESWM